MKRYEWPKKIKSLTKKRKIISDQFMQAWHKELVNSNKYNLIENFNHNYSEAF